MEKTNHYEILNIEPSSTMKEIKMAFKKLIKEHHPDKHSSFLPENLSHLLNLEAKKEVSMKIIEAYQCLTDSERRKTYDDWLNRESLKSKIFEVRHKDTISLSKSEKSLDHENSTANTQNIGENLDTKSNNSSRENNMNDSDEEEDDFTILVCQQCFGEVPIENHQFEHLHLKELSINCHHCGLYFTVVE